MGHFLVVPSLALRAKLLKLNPELPWRNLNQLFLYTYLPLNFSQAFGDAQDEVSRHLVEGDFALLFRIVFIYSLWFM